MPNTLGHLGVQALLTRSAFRKSDLIWIYIGLLIPDLPWITQRTVKVFFPAADLYDVRLYCVVQASLFFSLLLSAAFALLSRDFRKVFTLLSINVFLHLILDSFETKWGNGIQLFIPFDWSIINFGFFWPESIKIYAITAIGLIYIFIKWRDALAPSVLFDFNGKKVFISTAILCIYFLIPFFLIDQAESANNHYVGTLRNTEQHTGKYFEVDRGTYVRSSEGEKIITPFKGEYKIAAVEIPSRTLWQKGLGEKEPISIKAKFLSEDEIAIIDYHFHSAPLRDVPSYIGLFLIVIIIVVILKGSLKKTPEVKIFSGKEIPN
jgi:hypothetical protein